MDREEVGAPAMSDYFYSTDGRTRLGPVTARQLKQLAAERILAPNTLIWKEGLADWVPAERVKGLFPAPSPASRPAPAAEFAPAAHAARAPAAASLAAGGSGGYDLDPDPAALAAAGQRAPEARTWWYLRGEERTGPITRSALVDLVTKGIIRPEALVWMEGMEDWVEAKKVRALFP